MADWSYLLWILAVAAAVAGGVISVSAYLIRQQGREEKGKSRKSQIMYIASYVFMSISILLVAISGLLS